MEEAKGGSVPLGAPTVGKVKRVGKAAPHL